MTRPLERFLPVPLPFRRDAGDRAQINDEFDWPSDVSQQCKKILSCLQGGVCRVLAVDRNDELAPTAIDRRPIRPGTNDARLGNQASRDYPSLIQCERPTRDEARGLPSSLATVSITSAPGSAIRARLVGSLGRTLH